MSDLIERKAVLHAIESASCWGHTFNALCDEVRDMPSVTPESLVRHGRWLGGYWFWYEKPYCSLCGVRHDGITNYCPACGAKMDLEE